MWLAFTSKACCWSFSYFGRIRGCFFRNIHVPWSFKYIWCVLMFISMRRLFPCHSVPCFWLLSSLVHFLSANIALFLPLSSGTRRSSISVLVVCMGLEMTFQAPSHLLRVTQGPREITTSLRNNPNARFPEGVVVLLGTLSNARLGGKSRKV